VNALEIQTGVPEVKWAAGTVQSFVERSAAVQRAFEGGAVSVDDELKVG
jgi:hypothetical protein